MRTIDADALKAAFEMDGYLSPYMERMIDACPTVDAVKHGEWGEYEAPFGFPSLNGFPCSVCGMHQTDIRGLDFCPNCGAKMEGEK